MGISLKINTIYFDFNHSLGCVYPTLYTIRLLHRFLICYPSSLSSFQACLSFHKTGFLCAVRNFPLNNDLFKHARVFNFLDQKCSFESIHFLTEELKHYITFTAAEFLQMEVEFLLLILITVDDFEESELDEATIRTDESVDAKIYRIDILWYYLYMQKITGTGKSNFENLFKLANVVFSIVHSNAEEESLLSRVRKNLTTQRASLQLDGT